MAHDPIVSIAIDCKDVVAFKVSELRALIIDSLHYGTIPIGHSLVIAVMTPEMQRQMPFAAVQMVPEVPDADYR